jgi:hypothetical protein
MTTIVDALGSAPSEHAVHFLVTAYVESLRHFERTCGVPHRVIALPVVGAEDLGERLDALRYTHYAAEAVVVHEVVEVLGAALSRLDALGAHDPALVARLGLTAARSDTPHSSLSV